MVKEKYMEKEKESYKLINYNNTPKIMSPAALPLGFGIVLYFSITGIFR
jgi:hypothetical protein